MSIRRLKPDYIQPGNVDYVPPFKSFEEGELCFDETYGQYCTLQAGHDGSHVSHGPDEEMIAVWDHEDVMIEAV